MNRGDGSTIHYMSTSGKVLVSLKELVIFYNMLKHMFKRDKCLIIILKQLKTKRSFQAFDGKKRETNIVG